MVIKSGTNQLHGAVFEFLRNDDFRCARVFSRANVYPKTICTGTSSAAWHPVGSRRDKTFWLANYEGRREMRATPTYTVPTLAMRGGDFSEFLHQAIAGIRPRPSRIS